MSRVKQVSRVKNNFSTGPSTRAETKSYKFGVFTQTFWAKESNETIFKNDYYFMVISNMDACERIFVSSGLSAISTSSYNLYCQVISIPTNRRNYGENIRTWQTADPSAVAMDDSSVTSFLSDKTKDLIIRPKQLNSE